MVKIADGHLLHLAMKMLCAQEQIEGVIFEDIVHYVSILMPCSSWRIKVSRAGDAEFNRIYFCTGSNANDFLSRKLRFSDWRVTCNNKSFGQTVVGQAS